MSDTQSDAQTSWKEEVCMKSVYLQATLQKGEINIHMNIIESNM